MLADAVAQLIVGQAKRPRGLALVPAMFAERGLENRPLVRIDRRAQILDRIEIGHRRRRAGRRTDGRRRGRAAAMFRRTRAPWAVERVELDMRKDTAYAESPEYYFRALKARGKADKLFVDGKTRIRAEGGTYSTCAVPEDDWYLRVRKSS